MYNMLFCPKFEAEGSALKKTIVSLLTTGVITLSIIANGFCETTMDMRTQAPSENQYAVQIGTFLNENSAEQKIIELKNKGYEPYIFQSLNSKNQTVYAVRIGEYNDYQSAATTVSQIQSDLNVSAVIANYDSLETVAPPEKTGSEFKTAAAETAPPSQENKSFSTANIENQNQDTANNEEEMKVRLLWKACKKRFNPSRRK